MQVDPYAPPSTRTFVDSPTHVIWMGRVACVVCALRVGLHATLAMVSLPWDASRLLFELTPTVTGLGIVTFLVWVYFAAKRAWALNRLEISPLWCVGCFFVPILNFYKPYDVLNKIVHASKAGPKHPRSVVLCWGGYLIAWMIGLREWTSAESVQTVLYLSFLGASFVGMVMMITAVGRSQQTLTRKKPKPIVSLPPPEKKDKNYPAWIDLAQK